VPKLAPRAIHWPRLASSSLALQQIGHRHAHGLHFLGEQLLALTPRRTDLIVELGVVEPGQHLPGPHRAARSRYQLRRCAAAFAVQLTRLAGLQHALDAHTLGHGYACQHCKGQASDDHGTADGPQTLMLQPRATHQVLGKLENRQNDGGQKYDPSQRDAHIQILLSNKKDDGRHQHQPVDQAGHPVGR